MLHKTIHALWGQKTKDKDKDKTSEAGKKYQEAFHKYQQQEARTTMRPVAEEVDEEIDQGLSR